VTCPCKCCEEGKRCAHVLVLSAKDSSDATRLWVRFADNPPGFVNLKVAPQEQRAKRESQEPTEPALCRACGATFAVFVYLAKFLREQRAPMPHCGGCTVKAAPPVPTASLPGMWGHR